MLYVGLLVLLGSGNMLLVLHGWRQLLLADLLHGGGLYVLWRVQRLLLHRWLLDLLLARMRCRRLGRLLWDLVDRLLEGSWYSLLWCLCGCHNSSRHRGEVSKPGIGSASLSLNGFGSCLSGGLFLF